VGKVMGSKVFKTGTNMRFSLKRAVFLIGMGILLSTACTTLMPARVKEEPTQEGFAIYLLAQRMSPNEVLKADLSSLELEDKPILSADDIITYSKDTHEIELTVRAYQRLKRLKVPTSGIPFVVCVDRRPIYSGAFWVGYSSMSFHGVAIDVLYATQNHPIRIQLGYPASLEMFIGEDRRSDPQILQSLEQVGKLK